MNDLSRGIGNHGSGYSGRSSSPGYKCGNVDISDKSMPGTPRNSTRNSPIAQDLIDLSPPMPEATMFWDKILPKKTRPSTKHSPIVGNTRPNTHSPFVQNLIDISPETSNVGCSGKYVHRVATGNISKCQPTVNLMDLTPGRPITKSRGNRIKPETPCASGREDIHNKENCLPSDLIDFSIEIQNPKVKYIHAPDDLINFESDVPISSQRKSLIPRNVPTTVNLIESCVPFDPAPVLIPSSRSSQCPQVVEYSQPRAECEITENTLNICERDLLTQTPRQQHNIRIPSTSHNLQTPRRNTACAPKKSSPQGSPKLQGKVSPSSRTRYIPIEIPDDDDDVVEVPGALRAKDTTKSLNLSFKPVQDLQHKTRQAEIDIQKKLQEVCIASDIIQIDDSSESDVEVCEFPELSNDDKKIIDRASRNGPGQEVIIEKFGLRITRHDLGTLVGLNWLNDEVINFYMNLLTERSEQYKCNGYPSVYSMNTFFVPRLLQSGHAGVSRWTRKVDIFSYDIIPVPVHVGQVHWCMAIIHLKDKTIKYYDSMGTPNPAVLRALENYLKEESLNKRKISFPMNDWEIESVRNLPRQMNGSDCGVFSCMFAEYITRNRPITFSQQHMVYFRQKMILEIAKGKLLT